MVGIMIGSGIFRTPASIATEMGSPWLILTLWALGGVLSLFGALTYAELATMYPQSGGVYVFLREGFGRCTAFVFGWTYVLITKPLAAAGIAIVFGENVNRLLHVDWDPRMVTIAVLILLTGINILGMRLGSGVAVVLTAIKLGALAAIVGLGLALHGDSAHVLAGADAPKPFLSALMPVMFLILWTYDGWSDVGAVAGEVTDPQRRLPRIYLVGTIAVTVLYVLVNAVYMLFVPLAEMRGPEIQMTGSVAPVVMERLLAGIGGAGMAATAGGVIVTAIILVSTLGSTHGSIITGARVTFAQARDGLLFSFLARVHPRFQTPAVALVVQMVLSCTACWFVETFEAMAGGFVFTMWIFYGLAAASIFVLRAKRPDAVRPYRCWGYPVVPAVFIACAAGMTTLSIWQKPNETLRWLGVLVAGVPVYFVWRRWVGAYDNGAPSASGAPQ